MIGKSSSILAGVALASLSSLPALAQMDSAGFRTKGVAELSYLTSDGLDETFGYLNLRFAGSGSDSFPFSGPLVGFSLGIEAFAFDDESEAAFYGAINYDTGVGRISAGIPRFVLDDYIRTPVFFGSRLLDFELGRVVSGSVGGLEYLTGDTDPPLGLRYDGKFGDLKIGASAHRFEDEDATILDAAVKYSPDGYRLMAGVESVDSSSSSETGWMLGGALEGEMYEVGLLQSQPAFGGGDEDITTLWGTYSPLERLDLTAMLLSADSEEFYSLSAEYGFWQNAYARGSVVDSSDGDSELYDFAVGFRF